MFDLVIKDFPKNGTWVELGSWMGRSAVYCTVELLNADKMRIQVIMKRAYEKK
jgi:hypothetical protein